MYTVEIRRILKVSFVVIVILGLFLIAVTLRSFKEYRLLGSDTPAVNTITASGEGEAFAKPNIAEFTFSIVEESKSVASANEAVAKKENMAIDIMKEKGVEEDDIKTISYNVNPRYEYRRNNDMYIPYPKGSERILVAYEVRETIRVKSDDTEKAGELISSLGEIGVQNLSGLTFTVEDEDSVRSEARGDAIDNAKEKAEELADQLGVKLVRIVGFGQGGRYSPVSYAEKADFGMGNMVESSATPSIPVGENSFVERVTVTYEIR